MSTTISVSQARSDLPRILELIEAGEEVTLTRHGRDVAVIVRPDTLRARRTEQVDVVARKVLEMLGESTAPLAEVALLSAEAGTELLSELDRTRSNRRRSIDG